MLVNRRPESPVDLGVHESLDAQFRVQHKTDRADLFPKTFNASFASSIIEGFLLLLGSALALQCNFVNIAAVCSLTSAGNGCCSCFTAADDAFAFAAAAFAFAAAADMLSINLLFQRKYSELETLQTITHE